MCVQIFSAQPRGSEADLKMQMLLVTVVMMIMIVILMMTNVVNCHFLGEGGGIL